MSVHDDDELDELPPLDGDPGDPEDPRAESDLDDLVGPAGGADGLDDATGEDDPADASDLEIDEGDRGWLGESPDAGDLDLGDPEGLDIGEDEPSFVEAEEAGALGGDFGLEDVPEVAGLDSGEEGPVDADEELRDADLPSLDADDEGEDVDPVFIEDSITADQPLGLPWAEQPFPRVGAPVGLVPATAVACVARGALVAGRTETGNFEILRVDLEGQTQALPAVGLPRAEVGELSVEGDMVAAVLGDGRLLVSLDGGATFQPRAGGVIAADARLAGGALWVRTSARSLAVSVESGPFQRRSVAGVVAALAGDGQAGVVALTVDDAGAPVALLRGRPDGTIEGRPAGAPEPCGPEIVAARGECVAYPGRRGVVRRGPDLVWRAYRWEGTVTALAFVDGVGSLVAATYSDADDTTGLVLVDEAGKISVVARLGPAGADVELDGRTLSMACDDARGVLWVAGGFGVAALAIR